MCFISLKYKSMLTAGIEFFSSQKVEHFALAAADSFTPMAQRLKVIKHFFGANSQRPIIEEAISGDV